MKKVAIIVAAASLFVFAALAYGEMGRQGVKSGTACGCGMDGHMMAAEHMSKSLKDLNLDDQQKAFMAEIKGRMMKESIRKKADLQIAQFELKELLTQETVDMKAVEAKVRQIETMKADMHLSHIKAMEECKSKLTPEQRKKFIEMIASGPMMEGMEMKHDKKHDRKHGMKGKRAGAKHDSMKEKAE